MPTNISKCTIEEYCLIGDNREFYENIIQTTLEDYKPGGKRRMFLGIMIPLIKANAINSNNEEFKRDLSEY